jgi:alkylation response protein AidB-like acyl-CoA dehydrogenase
MLCVLAEEPGRALAPVLVSSLLYLAAELLLVAGDDAQKREHLPRFASGQSIEPLAAPGEGLRLFC